MNEVERVSVPELRINKQNVIYIIGSYWVWTDAICLEVSLDAASREPVNAPSASFG